MVMTVLAEATPLVKFMLDAKGLGAAAWVHREEPVAARCDRRHRMHYLVLPRHLPAA